MLNYKKRIANIILPIVGNIKSKLRQYDPKETILISGTPRSGTTWIAEVLRTCLGYNLLWGPLQIDPALLRKLKLSERPFIKNNRISKDQHGFFDSIMQCKFLNYNTLRLKEKKFDINTIVKNNPWIIKFV